MGTYCLSLFLLPSVAKADDTAETNDVKDLPIKSVDYPGSFPQTAL
jgi:hypothetical protein